tara:strand:+ start:11841 stop:13100 length:1260 start_codon:yes stop_codon:yes gene_type:complete
MLTFHKYQTLAFLYLAMALYITIIRKPIVITVFDAMLVSILLFNLGKLSFTSRIPTDRNLSNYLFGLLILMIIHMDLTSSLKEIIQMIEVYLFYVILVSYFDDYSDVNSDNHHRFLKSFVNIIFLGLIMSSAVDYIAPNERNLLNFLAVPLLIISVLTFFYETKIKIGILSNKFYSGLIAFFCIAVIYYENSRAAILFFVIFIFMLALQIKKRYLLPIIVVSFAALSLVSYVQELSQTESYQTFRYTDSGQMVYYDNLTVTATRGLGSLQVIFENMDSIIDFITTPDAGILAENIHGSNYERLFQVKFVYQAFVNYPIFGMGPNKAAEIANVHGIMLVTLADFGLVGLAILSLYIINSFRKVRSIIRSSKDIFDMFLYYYFIYSVIVLAFVSAGLLPFIPFVFISTLIHIRYHSLSFQN